MVETYRTDPLDYEKVFNNLVNGIIKYLTNSHIKAMVIGMSGGIDSTVVAALCKEVYNRTNGEFELIGVSMPCSTNKVDENDAATAAGTEFCTHFSVVSLESTFKAVEACCDLASNIASTPVSQGNIKARLRMITLYDIASKVGGIVMDTDNLTEHFLGFWTIHGDDGDFNPIGGLWKHEVYGLAKWMKENVYKDSKALEASIALMPTDGNGVKEGGDLAQIAPGKTYDDVDEILHTWVGLDPRIKLDVVRSGFQHGVFKQLCEKHGVDTVSMVIRRSINSEFKRKQRPFVIDIFNGNITEKNGKLF
jgi:nicotinamide-nucleotide amidase